MDVELAQVAQREGALAVGPLHGSKLGDHRRVVHVGRRERARRHEPPSPHIHHEKDPPRRGVAAVAEDAVGEPGT